MTLQKYRKDMEAAFRRHTRKGKWSDWDECTDCPGLLKDVCSELDRAHRELTQEKRFKDLMELNVYTYNKWKYTLMDDSKGEGIDFCSSVMEVFETIYEKGEEEFSHLSMLKMMEMLVPACDLDFFQGEILKFILENFKTPQDLSQKEAFLRKRLDELEKFMPDKNMFCPSIFTTKQYLVRVLADQKKPIEEIREILGNEIDYVWQKSLADMEKEYGNYEEAIALYKKLIEKRPEPYSSDETRNALMEIYELQGNQTEYKEALYGQMLAHLGEESLYKKFKASVTEEEWREKWEEITKKYKGHYDKIILWLSLENRYDLVMEAVEPDNGYLLEFFEDELFRLYPERCLQVLEKSAEKTARLSINRSDYRFLVRKLWELAALPGGKEISIKLARRLYAMYPRKRALKEELDTFMDDIEEVSKSKYVL